MTISDLAALVTAGIAVLTLIGAVIWVAAGFRERLGRIEATQVDHGSRLDRHHRWAEKLDRSLVEIREIIRAI